MWRPRVVQRHIQTMTGLRRGVGQDRDGEEGACSGIDGHVTGIVHNQSVVCRCGGVDGGVDRHERDGLKGFEC